jgi:uncharacterized surface anchored protein
VKLSKSSFSILIGALSFSTMFVASVFTTGSTVVARVQVSKPMSSDTPIEGVGVAVFTVTNSTARPVRGLAFQTDAQGNFTVGELAPGSYDVSLECKTRTCQRTNTGESRVQFALNGPNANVKKVMSKREFLSGEKFRIEIGGSGNKQHGPYTGKVTLVR